MRKHPVEPLRDGAPAQLVAMVTSRVLVVEDLHEAVSFGGKLHLNLKNSGPSVAGTLFSPLTGESSARRLVNGVCYYR